MAMTDRIKDFMQSPRGKKMMDRGRAQMQKPQTQQKLRELAQRVTGKTGPHR
ncbi:hypothetical protein SAMN05444365_10190 [Micromonospora pattaloongensis]|uniref:MT0933-like antitoxin protein n=1 Tax=Micromonospora pattaloongensis TaxID=405436 RepID=A0A1H3FNA5_9ACTN|nr:hypothetical protein [Micromonospora pattaloongensis]SDX92390.1 hypothetical protein SAMN05444365_10190 [Micromonospora pattaloongensis]